MLKLTEYGEKIIQKFIEKLMKDEDYTDYCEADGLNSSDRAIFEHFIYDEIASSSWMLERATNMEEVAVAHLFYWGEGNAICEIEETYKYNATIVIGTSMFTLDDLVSFIEDKCLYETNPRLSQITAYAKKKKKEVEDAINKEEKELASYKETMAKLKEQIFTLIETANACIQAGIDIKKFHHSSDIGFIVMKNGIFYIGYGVAVCGREAIVYTNGEEMGVKRISDNAVLRPSPTHFEKLFTQYTEFETNFYTYVDKTINIL